MGRDHPAIEVHAAWTDPPSLPLGDAVGAVVDDHQPFAIEERPGATVRVYFLSIADRNAALTALQSAHGSGWRTRALTVTADDWATRSQADLTHIQVDRVIVAPPWDIPTTSPADNSVLVQIRPSLGFGSGHHPTTRLALRGLQTLALRDREVLDIGTGSGVLAIAAVKLGAAHAVGIDRDPDALASASDSVDANDVSAAVTLQLSDMTALGSMTTPVIVANLTGATLTRFAATLARTTRPGGHLVLSGVLDHEEASVVDAYRNQARLTWRATEDEWVGHVWELPENVAAV
ncbi:MAG: 50S ribosomal protein L11 methyltransferase [Acidobacteriota bacterium]|nr:50S ribosomal protein L11 methyltransferase [Acidobacteriota bacterium]